MRLAGSGDGAGASFWPAQQQAHVLVVAAVPAERWGPVAVRMQAVRTCKLSQLWLHY